MKEKGEFIYSGVYADTIDRVVDFADKETIQRAIMMAKNHNEVSSKDKIDISQIKDVGEIPGQLFNGWNYRKGLVIAFLNALDELPCARGFVGHIQDKQIEEEDGSKHAIKTINIGGQLGAAILAWSDHTLFLQGVKQGDKLKRWIRTRPSRGLDCKSRDSIIPDMLEFPPDNTNEQNWQLIRKFFD